MNRWYRVRVPRLTLKTIFVAVATTVALIQLVAVTLAALPPNRYSDVAAPHTTYLQPMFAQNWRLFAPSPIADDRTISFQGSYRANDGSLKQTAWVDWTEVELDLVHHRLVGGRAGYVTNKLSTPLGSVFSGLATEQRTVAGGTDEMDPPTWAELRTLLVDAGDGSSRDVAPFLRYERAVTQLATGVLQGRWPGRSYIAVRYSFRSQAVTPYAARNGTAKEREVARPSTTERIGGWRQPMAGSDAERSSIADFDRRHR